MEFVTNFANVKPSIDKTAINRANALAVERIRKANASLQQQLRQAQHKNSMINNNKEINDKQFAAIKNELVNAHKTIATLESRIKELTLSLNKTLAINKAPVSVEQKPAVQKEPAKVVRQVPVAQPVSAAPAPVIKVSPLVTEKSDSSSK